MNKRNPTLWLASAVLILVSALLAKSLLKSRIATTWTNTYVIRRWDGDILLTAEQVRDSLLNELGRVNNLPRGFPQVETLVIDPHPTTFTSQLEPRKAYRLNLDEAHGSLLVFYRLQGECEVRYWPYTLYLLPPWPWSYPEIGCSARVLVEAPLELDVYVRSAFERAGAKPYLP